MSIATVENNVARPMYARRMPQSAVAVNTDPVATPACAPHDDPLARIAALLVSISRNTTDLQRLFEHPQVGRPEFVELPR